MNRRILLVAGLLDLVFAAFHLLLPNLLDWQRTLQNTAAMNQAVMFTFNAAAVLQLLAFAYFYLRHADELAGTGLGRAVAAYAAAFWLVRGIAQVVYFGTGTPFSLAAAALFAVIGVVHAAPLLSSARVRVAS